MSMYGQRILELLEAMARFDEQSIVNEHADIDHAWDLLNRSRDLLSDMAKWSIDAQMNPVLVVDAQTEE